MEPAEKPSATGFVDGFVGDEKHYCTLYLLHFYNVFKQSLMFIYSLLLTVALHCSLPLTYATILSY